MLSYLLRFTNYGLRRFARERCTMLLATIAAAVAAVGIPLAVPTYASSAGVPSAAAMAALGRQGLSPERAGRAIEVQGEVAQTGLVGKVEAAMAGAFAGAWLEPQAAQLHIGVTSPSSRQAAEQIVVREGLTGDVTMTPVRSTWADLLAAQARWSKKLASLLVNEEAMMTISSQRNALSITLSPSIPSQERVSLEQEAANASVNVFVELAPSAQALRVRPEAKPTCEKKFTSGSAFCEKTLTSGVGWQCSREAGAVCDTTEVAGVGLQCTAGPMLIKGTETYMLTAGHCFGSKSPEGEPLKPEAIKVKVSSAYPGGAQKEIGKEGSWFENKERDIAEVKIIPGGSWTEPLPNPVPAFIAEWGTLPEKPHEVTDKEASIEGQVNCHEGATSGEQCGLVGGVTGEGYVEDTACSEGGDSGGPWFTRQITSGEEFIVLMQGTHVGKIREKVTCGAIPEFTEEVQTNENTKLTGLKAIGGMKVGWEVSGKGIVKGTEVTEIKEVKAGEFTVTISKAATTKEKVKLVFKPFFRALYEPISTILATFKGQRLLTTANEVRMPRVRGAKGKVLTKKAFTGTSGVSTIETKAGNKLICTADTGKGEAGGLSTGTVKITLTGCEGFGGKCHSAGSAEGEVVLSGSYTLVFVSGAKDEVGWLLEVKEAATIECAKGAQKLKVRGSAIGPTTPIDEEVVPPKKFTVAFSQAKGVQAPTEYQNEKGVKVKATLEMEGSGAKVFAFEQAGISSTEELTFEETAEIEA